MGTPQQNEHDNVLDVGGIMQHVQTNPYYSLCTEGDHC